MLEFDPSAAITKPAESVCVAPLWIPSNRTLTLPAVDLVHAGHTGAEPKYSLAVSILRFWRHRYRLGSQSIEVGAQYAHQKPQLVLTMVCPCCALGSPLILILTPGGRGMTMSRLTRSCFSRNLCTAGPIVIPASSPWRDGDVSCSSMVTS
jgi:hypothetical protein